MDTCVRNNYYEEALELMNYVKRLEKKLSSIKILSVSLCGFQHSTIYFHFLASDVSKPFSECAMEYIILFYRRYY